MTPAFSTKIRVAALQARVTDLFNYSTLIFDAAYGNFTAKVGNSIFHQNTDYNSSADIVVNTNTYKDIDLPTADGNILNAAYTFIENVRIVNEVLYRSSVSSGYLGVTAPAGNNFTFIDLTSVPTDWQVDVAAIVSSLDDVRVGFYNSGNVLLASVEISSVSGTGLNFSAVSLASFATIAKIRIIGTNTYTTTHNYSYSGCPVVTPKLQAPADCYRSQMTVTDCTAYPAGVTLARTMTIQSPTLADGSHVLGTVTTSDASKTLGPNIFTGGYTIDLSSVLTWQQDDDDLYIELTIAAQITPTVTCSSGLCSLAACIAKFHNKYLAALANGSKTLGALQADNIVISMYIGRIQIAIQCEDTTTASALITALTAYMQEGSTSEGCDCGCSDSTTNSTPTEIFPLFSVPSTDGRLVVYNSGLPYPVMQLVYFEGQEFLVTTATIAGENPISTPAKFKWIGGGVYIGNTAANSSGGTTATLTHRSGVITFSGLTPVAAGAQFGFVITNSTLAVSTDVEVYLTNPSDGYASLDSISVLNGQLVLAGTNTHPTDDLTNVVVWLNNRR